MAYRTSYTRKNADGSKTDVLIYKAPGISIKKETTSYDYTDTSDSFDNLVLKIKAIRDERNDSCARIDPKDRITLRKVTKNCDACEECEKAYEKSKENLGKILSDRYDVEDLENLSENLDNVLSDKDTLIKVIDILVSACKENKE